jgi:UDP-N-acetylglucosamine/UDP-N-acetylgalactosamine diphosphorylase
MNALLEKGVTILHPESTWIDDTVNVDRISESAVIHPGCRISGSETSIGSDCVLGEEAPTTIDNCQLASSVRLKGGFFSESVFLDGASMASSAHVRPGTILEEQATCGHAVGLKQTVLLPFVTLGSLINFCDCLMSGGTDRLNHSEVGSSFVHFNFTPYQDKATASLFGSIPEGVMLDQQPVFLGGQAGAVGPVKLAHGCTLAAGSILRKDCTDSGTLIIETGPSPTRIPTPGPGKRNYRRIVATGLEYIGSIAALKEWYLRVRKPISEGNAATEACCTGAVRCLDMILAERIRRLSDVLAGTNTLEEDLERFRTMTPALADSIVAAIETASGARDEFLGCAGDLSTVSDYLAFIKGMPDDSRLKGTEWLKSIIRATTDIWRA